MKNSCLFLLVTCLLTLNFTVIRSQTADNMLSAKEKVAGFSLLFNGKDLTGWRSPNQLTPPENGWEVVDGTLHVLDSAHGGKSSDLITVKQYKAFELLFDFKLTEGANSGVKYFVTESPQSPRSGVGLEFQLLDDERHADAKMGTEGNRTLGSLYDLIPSIKPEPGKEKKIGEWNHGKIIVYPNNLVQHWLNGLKVVEYERGSGTYRVLVAHSKFAKIKGFGLGEQGPILLQDHGNSVFFKNIKIREIK